MLGLSEGCTLTLDGVQHDAGRNTLLSISVLDCVIDSLHVMAIDFLSIQAEGLSLLSQAAMIQNGCGGAIQLIAVVIKEINDVVQLLSIGKVQAFPNLALVSLTVTDDAENVVVAAVDLVAQSGAGSGGSALAQRTGGQVNTGSQLAVGMAGELGVVIDALIKAASDPDNWKYALGDLPELINSVCTYYKNRFNVNLPLYWKYISKT